MSDLVGIPEDRFSHNEAHLRRAKNCYIGDELVRNLHTCEFFAERFAKNNLQICPPKHTNASPV